MISKNIWQKVQEPLELHEDNRGRIVDVFYNHDIHHVAMIDSKAGSIRGNHYHKETTQHILITKGELEYWYKDVDDEEDAKFVHMFEGDILTTPPNEIHALNILTDNQFIVFSEGTRGGKDYEKDTFRIGYNIILNTESDNGK
tara:strand:- start:759 stop:1187 length:429 start_codon:yes stop_codon:yes gene_type:complete